MSTSGKRVINAYVTSTISITLLLFLIGILFLVVINASQLARYVREKIGFTLILHDNIKEIEVIQLQKQLSAAQYIKSTRYIDKETAARDLQEQLGENFIGFLGFNPLFSSVEVKLVASYTNPDSIASIEKELIERLAELKSQGKLLEAQRLEMRTRYDLEMLREIGYCAGIENYSRHLSGRQPGERPGCLLDYFPENFLIFIDESHITIPQIGGMYQGDRARKQTLVDYGFRLPSALDNRPLKFAEFENLVPQAVYVSATPGPYELTKNQQAGSEIVEQIIRPTGLIDPKVVIKPTANQIDDLIEEITERVKRKERVLVTTLTKRMSEDLSAYLEEKGLLVRYLHSEIDSLQRIEILGDLRRGKFDCLVGINLLREGLDLPEVSLVAVLDADKEGFLRSETSLIQICGRAARNLNGEVILYADTVTGSMRRALQEMRRRRKKQVAYNKKNDIVPRSIKKAVQELEEFARETKKETLMLIREDGLEYAAKQNLPQLIKQLESEMDTAAVNLDFELAAALRDKLFALQEMAPKKLFSVKIRKNLLPKD